MKHKRTKREMYANKRKEKMQVDTYLGKTSHQLAFKSLCRDDEIYRS